MKPIQPMILVVDDKPNNLKLLQEILRFDYQLIFATNGEQAIEAALSHQPNLILLDIMMPDMNGYQVCEQLKSDPQTSNIPVIFITAMNQAESESKGFDVGGVDYITKPVSAPIVKRRIENQLSLVQTKQLESLVKASILMLGQAGHFNDTDTGKHIWRMAAYAGAIARAIGCSSERVKMIELAAPLHDTGKIGIPDEILKAPRKLNHDEWLIMKNHSQIGHDILSKSDNPIFQLAAQIALGHHEKWDGSGYPNGLKGTEIPQSARIVAIADVFDALTMVRPYKTAWTVEQAFSHIQQQAGSHFDPNMVNAFCEIKSEILALKQHWREEN